MEKVILVDTNDKPIGLMEKLEAHKKALLHRAVSVFLFNSEGKMLIQRRALSKYHSPGLWTNTACTHPRENESVSKAGIRRLNEEMGIEYHNLTKIFDFIYKEKLDNELTEYEFDHVFVGESDIKPNFNTKEVCEYNYVGLEDLKADVIAHPEKYTVWFRKIYLKVMDYYAKNR
ncbi:MAG: isopentenyl-diphosphate Delta-isomerase [Marinifilaceae bacterium]|jgi:isopentenyl-diphosphate delta-isomerase|nr:isopentenyl-diphosphate Delta-isomerase [Marinifilaceae bacterium]